MKTEEHNPQKRPALWRLLLGQILLTGLVLCVFALFHHVIPMYRIKEEGIPAPKATVARAEKTAQASEAPDEPADPAPDQEQVPEAEQEQELPDTWQTRFAEHFAAEPTWTEYSYQSPNLSVTVSSYENTDTHPRQSYYVADLYIAEIESFRTGFPENATYDDGESIARSNGAIIAINGDSMLTQKNGLLIRNGEIYFDQPNSGDLCVLYYDGTMETYSPSQIDVESILAREPFQTWQFGPSLLDENGQPLENFNISRELQDYHPRTAVGYFEPGHYCFVVVDGRAPGHSDGADMRILAEIMCELGCKVAYNLDGGASSMMIFNGETVNIPSKTGPKNLDRYINDMLILVEPQKG